MRFLHTADWHLGRLFHGVHLTADQERVLDRLVELAREVRPDAIVVAGDVYDRAVPPPQAVGLLDDVLSRLVLGLRIPVVMVAGNHDSPERLEFGSRLLSGQGLHVAGWPGAAAGPVTLTDAHGQVSFCPLPFAEPALVRGRLEEPEVHDHEDAVRALAARMLAAVPAGARRVAVGHAFVCGGEVSDSERPLAVGMAAAVSPTAFAGFHYAALGHLHRPQTLSGGLCAYSGSLLKYSFSEIGQEKGVALVELDAQGGCSVERLPLRPARDLRRLEGFLDDILNGRVELGDREDYLVVSLLDRTPLLDAMSRLQRLLPNVLHLERPALATPAAGTSGTRPGGLSLTGLFGVFFSEVTGEDLSQEQSRLLSEVLQGLEAGEREASPGAAGPIERPAEGGRPAEGEQSSGGELRTEEDGALGVRGGDPEEADPAAAEGPEDPPCPEEARLPPAPAEDPVCRLFDPDGDLIQTGEGGG